MCYSLFIFPQNGLKDIRTSSYLILLKSLITFHVVKTEEVKWMKLAQKRCVTFVLHGRGIMESTFFFHLITITVISYEVGQLDS